MGKRTWSAAVGIVIALGVALTGCAPSAPAPTGTPVGSPTMSTTPEPTAPPAEDVVAIVVGPLALELVDTTGTPLESFAYDDPSEEARARLTSLFGQEPVVEDNSTGKIPNTTYQWAGISIFDPDGDGGEFIPDWSIAVTAPALGDVDFRSIEGTVVGASVSTVRERYPEHPDQVDANGGRHFSISVAETPVGTDGQGNEHTYSVFISAQDPDSPIESIGAPYTNFGD